MTYLFDLSSFDSRYISCESVCSVSGSVPESPLQASRDGMIVDMCSALESHASPIRVFVCNLETNLGLCSISL